MLLIEEPNSEYKPTKSQTTRKGRAIRSGRTEQARLLDDICWSGDRRGAIIDWLAANKIGYSVQGQSEGFSNIVVGAGIKRYCAGHYDAVEGTPGANDNAASIVALLRAVKNGLSSDSTVVLFDGEELMHWKQAGSGSRVFANDLASRRIKPELFIVLDVVGIGDQIVVGSQPCCVPMLERLRAESGESVVVRDTPPSDHAFMMPMVGSVLLSTVPSVDLNSPHPAHWQRLHSPADEPSSVSLQNIDRMAMMVSRLLS